MEIDIDSGSNKRVIQGFSKVYKRKKYHEVRERKDLVNQQNGALSAGASLTAEVSYCEEMEGVYFVWGGSCDGLGKELDSGFGDSRIAQIGYCFIVILVSSFSFLS